MLMTSALEALWNALAADEGAAFSYSDYFEERGNDVRIVRTKDALPLTIAGEVMIRRQLFATEGFYRAGLGLPEYDLLLRTQSRWRGPHVAAPL